MTSVGAQDDSVLCTNPRLRKEWRTLTDTDKETWTGAVKVMNFFTQGYIWTLIRLEQCLVRHSTSTHNNVEPKQSDPLYNTSGSLYDGASCKSLCLLVNDPSQKDFTYVHMKLNNDVGKKRTHNALLLICIVPDPSNRWP